LLQEKQSSTTPSPAGPAPTPRWRLDHGRLLPSPGGSGSRANGNGIKAAGTRLDIVGAPVVRRPPQHPPGEGDELTCFRGSGGSVASRCRPGGDAAIQQRGGLGSSTGGLQLLPRLLRLLPPFSFSSSSPLLLSFSSRTAARAWRLRPTVHLLHSFPLPLPLWIAARHEEKPQGLLARGATADLGNSPMGGGAVQGGRLGAALKGRRPRVWG
jgi:hypothetical protein